MYWNTCQTLRTSGVTILGISVGWVGGVVEYMSDSWYWLCYHTEGQCGWWCSGVHVRLLVLVVLPYRGSVWVGGVVKYMSDSWYWWCYHTEGQCGLVV